MGVVVEQLVEWLLSTLEVRASNPVTFCIVNCIEMTKIKKKRTRMAQLEKLHNHSTFGPRVFYACV